MAIHDIPPLSSAETQAHLSLVGEEPKHPVLSEPVYPEMGARGEITAFEEDQDLARSLGVRSVIHVDIEDPQVAADPENYARVTTFVNDLMEHVRAGGHDRVVSKIDEISDLNPSAQIFYDRSQAPALTRWYETHVPYVMGLEVLQNVGPGNKLVDGTEMPVDEQSEAYFRFVLDAIGIRNRARIMEAVVLSHILDQRERGVVTADRIEWLSQACGAADPAFKAGRFISEQTDGEITTEFTLADINKTALALAEKKALEMGYSEDDVNISYANIIDPRKFNKLAHPSGRKYRIAEALGFLEYFGRGDFKEEGQGLLWGAENFIRNSRELVDPVTGLYLFGNMLDTHPQIDFTTKVVSWPEIRPRPLTEIVDMTMAAGVPGQDIELLLPNDDGYGNSVYAVVALRNALTNPKLSEIIRAAK